MSIAGMAARLRPLKIQRYRRGYTLLEAVLVLALISILTLGLGVLVVSIREQMWVSAQLRATDNWANEYANSWSRTVRNAIEVNITRITPPIQMDVTYVHPKDRVNKLREYQFRFNQRDQLPELRIDGQRQWSAHPFSNYEYDRVFPPENGDKRDHFYSYASGQKGFMVHKCTRTGLQNAWRDNYLTLEFTVVYRRDSSLSRRRPFIREMHYTASAYSVNPNWPTTDNGIIVPEDE